MKLSLNILVILLIVNAFETIDAFGPKRSRFLKFHRHNDGGNNQKASLQRKRKLVKLIANAKSKDTYELISNALINALASKTTKKTSQNLRYALFDINLI